MAIIHEHLLCLVTVLMWRDKGSIWFLEEDRNGLICENIPPQTDSSFTQKTSHSLQALHKASGEQADSSIHKWQCSDSRLAGAHNLYLHTHCQLQQSLAGRVFKLVLAEPCEWHAHVLWVVCSQGEDRFSITVTQWFERPWIPVVTNEGGCWQYTILWFLVFMFFWIHLGKFGIFRMN